MEKWQLEQMKSLPLSHKIIKTKSRIREWYEAHDGNVYVSFSGGKDSTVLLHLVREMYPEVVAVFVDTGLEYPEIREFVKTIDNVVWLKPKMPFTKVIEKYGYPVVSKEQAQFIYDYRHASSEKTKDTRLNGNKWGRGKISNKWKFLLEAPFKISAECCDVMKKQPIKKFEKETGLKPFLGILAEESARRLQEYLKHGCNAFEAVRPISRPLGFWREKDILDYLRKKKVPYSKIYDMGYKATGCMFCAFGCHLERSPNRFQRMKITHPKIWEYCMFKLGMAQVLDFIGVKYE